MKRSSIAMPRAGAVAAVAATVMLSACGGGSSGGGASGAVPTLRVLHAFGGGTEPQAPYAGVISGVDGKLYGVTEAGGTHNAGALFAIDPNSDQATTLVSFGGTQDTEQKPIDPLVSDSVGNLYGTTQNGGQGALGSVFKVDAKTGAETVLYAFTGGADGATPSSPLLIDAQGNLFGTTFQGGPNDAGVVFQISPGGAMRVVYAFGAAGAAGPRDPIGALALDSAGHLYGATRLGGTQGKGTVYQLTLGSNGAPATLAVLHNFSGGADGANPWGGVVLDAAQQMLYGTTFAGGPADNGTVFACPVDGSAARVLYAFKANGSGDGAQPIGALAIGKSGTLYGTTSGGGSANLGTVFSVAPSSGAETLLHSFTGPADGDGEDPRGSLIIDAAGELVGTTIRGGAQDNGTVFVLSR